MGWLSGWGKRGADRPAAKKEGRRSLVRRPEERHESPVLEARIAGVRLRAVYSGPGPKRAPTIVFLHEALGCIAMWRDFPEAIARQVNCNALVYERQGHGGSDPLTLPGAHDYHRHEAEAVLPALLDHFGLGRVILVGHSDGGTIALLFAAAYPERTIGVATLAAHAYVEPLTIAGIDEAIETFAQGTFRERLLKYHGPNTDALVKGWADCWRSEAFRDWNIEDRLKAIRAPALVMQGADDSYASPEHLTRIALACGGPTEAVLLPDCAHQPQSEARDEVLARLARFIRALPKE